jgi:multidrug efflux pump subunit AcrA (membrane-fusion protein)
LGVPTLLALSGIFFLAGCGQDAAAPPPPPAPNVIVTPVLQQSVPIYAEFVGQTESPQTVEIRARIEGFLEQINFTEGAEVSNGQLLFGIDARQYKVELEKAKALLQWCLGTVLLYCEDQFNRLKGFAGIAQVFAIIEAEPVEQASAPTKNAA